MRLRLSWMIGLALTTALAHGQSWMSSYDAGLAAGRKGEWSQARDAFKRAAAFRTDDMSGPTMMPGPATERRVWRNGAPYSPNFLAAYSGYRVALSSKDDIARNNLLKTVADEFELLISKKQYSYETFYFANAVYAALSDNAKRMRIEQTMAQISGQLTWKVDGEVLSPEEVASISSLAGQDVNNPSSIPATDPGTTTTPTTNANSPMLPATGARVPVLSSKFALVIGNSESRLDGQAIPFATDDAQFIRESLITNAGYGDNNVDLVMNATREQMLSSAKALADRIPEGATVFIYFTGAGANLDGKDFLAGVDTESATDSSRMVAKMELYRLFMAKGARIFAFFQVNRSVANGRYFGMEVPLVGSMAQSQATIPGDAVQSFVRNGKTRGVYTDALAATLGEFRSNRVPIQEFGWQVFYRIRRGDSGSMGGGSRQTPTLPVLTNLASDARF